MNLQQGLQHLVARHRRNPVVRRLHDYCGLIHAGYENQNYDPKTNGEGFVLRRLAAHPVQTIFDVGANVGDWALMARRVFPAADIHCFELVPRTCEELRQRTASIPGIRVNAFGLGERPGNVMAKYFPKASALSSVADYPHRLGHQMVECAVLTGDEYLSAHGISHVDVLKIDVEGGEYGVLGGFSEALRTGRIDVIQFEYGMAAILMRVLLRDFYELLEGHGYALGKIYPNYVEFRACRLEDEDFRGPNFLAVRRDRVDLIRSLGGGP